MVSRFASPSALRGFSKTGNVICPGDSALPRFSDTGFLAHVDRLLEDIPADDRAGLCTVMTVFGALPSPVLRGALQFIKHAKDATVLPDSLKFALRGLHFGIRGVVFSLYYSQLPTNTGAEMTLQKELAWETERTRTLYKNRSGAPTNLTVGEIYARAKAANEEIRSLSLKQRLAMVKALRLNLLAKRDEIMDLIQLETKKSRTDALVSEIFSTLDFLRYLETSAPKQLRDRKVHTPVALMGKSSKVAFDPLGTVLVVSPWNYPLFQALVPSVLAFVCGNSVIYKPSEFTPMAGLLEELLAMSGFKDSWIQVTYGDGAWGQSLIEARPDKIFFTGSVATGKKISLQASQLLIPVELELGGKDPMIVFEDVNLRRAAAGALWGAFTNCGQACTSVERLYVHEKIYDKFRAELLSQMSELVQGIDTDGHCDIGGMTTAAQIKIVYEQLAEAQQAGAQLTAGPKAKMDSAEFLAPTLVEGNLENTRIAREESFGPILPLMRFSSEDEVIAMANDSDFGLSASVWSADLKRAERVARKLQTGNVSINNVMLTEGNPALPFGGVKNSGIGRYKGEFGYYAFTNIKSILTDKDSGKIESNWYPFTTKKYRLFDRLTEQLLGRGGVMAFIRFALTGMKLESHSQKKRE